MGDIFRRIDVCGITAEGDILGCASGERAPWAVIDPGATKTVFSSKLANAVQAPWISGINARVEGRAVPLHLASVQLRAPACEIDALAVAVDDVLVGRAGLGPGGVQADVVLGHDYLQNKQATVS